MLIADYYARRTLHIGISDMMKLSVHNLQLGSKKIIGKPRKIHDIGYAEVIHCIRPEASAVVKAGTLVKIICVLCREHGPTHVIIDAECEKCDVICRCAVYTSPSEL